MKCSILVFVAKVLQNKKNLWDEDEAGNHSLAYAKSDRRSFSKAWFCLIWINVGTRFCSHISVRWYLQWMIDIKSQ